MSLETAGVWQVGVWATTVWADGVWREGEPPPQPEPEPRQTGAGRKRRRYVVEIDGREFEVANAREAQAVLDHARALAERAAELAATKVVERRKPESRVRKVTLLPPKVSASPELQIDLKPLRAELAKIYRNAAAIAELQLLLKRSDEEDEEEALALLIH